MSDLAYFESGVIDNTTLRLIEQFRVNGVTWTIPQRGYKYVFNTGTFLYAIDVQAGYAKIYKFNDRGFIKTSSEFTEVSLNYTTDYVDIVYVDSDITFGYVWVYLNVYTGSSYKCYKLDFTNETVLKEHVDCEFADVKNSKVVTTAGTSTSTTVVITDGSTTDDAYNNMWLAVKHASGGAVAMTYITDYVGSTQVATLAEDISIVAGDDICVVDEISILRKYEVVV